MNESPVNMTGDGGDMMSSELFNALPNVTDAFEVTYVKNITYEEFYDAVYEHRLDGDPYPYRYGSYQVFRANRIANLYQIGVFINVTSQDVSALYSQYMYTAILRAATNTPDLEFNIVSRPFPIY